MKFVPNSVSMKVGRLALKASHHSPVILLGVGVTGVVVAGVTACRATLRLEEVLEENRKTLADIKELAKNSPSKYTESDRKHDITVVYINSAMKLTKLYGPSIILGAFSIGCIIGGHKVLSGRNAALTAAYAGLEKSFKAYRERVRSEIGDEKERDIWLDAKKKLDDKGKETQEKVVGTDKDGGLTGGSEYAVIFDWKNPNWKGEPMFTEIFLDAQRQWAQDMLDARGHLFLNEVYTHLGIKHTTAGSRVGWFKGHLNSDGIVDFAFYWHSDDEVEEGYYMTQDGAFMLDFNVDGDIHRLLDEAREARR